MPNSFVSVRATEGQTTFPFSFPNGYLSEDHIRTYVDGTEVSRTISGGTAIIAPVASGQEVVVARQSPQTPYIAFEDGSILNKQNIDTQNRHAFMLAEEAAEQRDFFALGDIDMNYHKIIHVSPGTDQYDVVNKGQFDYFLSINEDMAERAESAALDAEGSAQTASNAAAAAAVSEGAAADSAEFAADTVAGFDAHAASAQAEVTAEGDQQVARVIAEGDVQYGRAKGEADRAKGYAEILERPYEDMGAHTIQQGYPPVPNFSSMWMVVDGGLDPIDGVTVWNVGDVLVYSVQTALWSRLSGAALGGGGDPLPIEILDDLIMQEGKKIRFRDSPTTDVVALTLDTNGNIHVGDAASSVQGPSPVQRIGLVSRELYHVPEFDVALSPVAHAVITAIGGQTINGALTLTGLLTAGSIATAGALSAGSVTTTGALSAGSMTTAGSVSANSATITTSLTVNSVAAAAEVRTQASWAQSHYVGQTGNNAVARFAIGVEAGNNPQFIRYADDGSAQGTWMTFHHGGVDSYMSTGTPLSISGNLTATNLYADGKVEGAGGSFVNAGQPYCEFHIPGVVARAQWINSEGLFYTGTSNGAGSGFAAYQYTSPAGLYHNGNGDFNDVYIRSDERLKSNLEVIGGALAKVQALTGFTYDKARSLEDNTTNREAGVIAQDLAAVLPEAVGVTADGLLTVSPSAQIALLVEAVKELAAQVEELRNGR